MATTIKSKVFTTLNAINDYLQDNPNIQPMGIQSSTVHYEYIFYYRESESEDSRPRPKLGIRAYQEEIAKLKDQLEELKDDYDQKVNHIKYLEKNLSETECDLDKKVNYEIPDLESEIQDLNNKNKDLESRNQDLEVALTNLETKLSNSRALKLSNSRALNNRIHSHYRNRVAELEQKLQETKDELRDRQCECEELQVSDHKAAQQTKEIQVLKAQIKGLEQYNKNQQETIQNLKSHQSESLTVYQKEIERLTQENQNLKQKNQELIASEVTQASKHKEEIKILKSQIENSNTEIDDILEQNEKIQHQLEQKEKEIHYILDNLLTDKQIEEYQSYLQPQEYNKELDQSQLEPTPKQRKNIKSK